MNPPTLIDAKEFAEVVYRGANNVLVVNVATDLAEDSSLAGALMDVIATANASDTAESAIATLASELDLELLTGEGRARGERHVTIRAPLLSASHRIGPETSL